MKGKEKEQENIKGKNAHFEDKIEKREKKEHKEKVERKVESLFLKENEVFEDLCTRGTPMN